AISWSCASPTKTRQSIRTWSSSTIGFTNPISRNRLKIHVNGFIRIRTYLEGFSPKGTVQQLLTTEGGGFRNPSQLTLERSHFLLQRRTVFGTIRAVGSLQSQVTHPLQNGGGF